MNSQSKILSRSELPGWREALRRAGRRLAVTNGCFDLLHAGHVTYLESARETADALLVAVNSDASVRRLKGPGRPVNGETDRARVLAALACVDAVTIFDEPDACAVLGLLAPEVYVKGGDYTLETINQDERRLVERLGGRVLILPGVPGLSTTVLLQRLQGGQ
ncbi:adenylyltransferase/cytidyltransferase family protein [Fontisphaera persica]|uniref:adenylyltransferase/cytidyltransferase family protein n=1 Tax=Fontisphaera persica TaxID=2974023 RepID=UPI0024BFF615|nr:adenylyltransferase/cytidyltransferase family protein [Fontisphaera persica]WCJ60504.1 adenylyltransferase/cytidyltransferase family protein [Fontisphaera persica]